MLYSYQRYHTDERSQLSRSDCMYFDNLVVERVSPRIVLKAVAQIKVLRFNRQ